MLESESAAAPDHQGWMPLVSIITVCKNSAQFLERCVQSVLDQDYPRIEYIVQDCVSTDGTLEVLEKCEGRLQLVSEPDRGIGDAIGRALQRARGEIVSIILADEHYHPHAVSWAVHAFLANPEAGVIYGDYRSVNEHYEELAVNRWGPMSYTQIFCVERVIPCQTAFIRTACLREVGWYADPAMFTCPDFELWVRIGLRYPITYVPGVIADNMVHSGSSTSQPSSYPAFVRLKKRVILRTVADPSTPPSIRQLRARALAGLYLWAAASVVHQDKVQGLGWYVRSFLARPDSKALHRVLWAILLLTRNSTRALRRRLWCSV